jgi:hypothetical protein
MTNRPYVKKLLVFSMLALLAVAAGAICMFSGVQVASAQNCPTGQYRCGKACYDFTKYQCLGGVICANNQHLCGKACYDFTKSQCLSGVICANNQHLSGKACRAN